MDTQQEPSCIRWILRITDDMWGAAQLLGLFFLGATILCVPPHLNPPADSVAFSTLPPAVHSLSASPIDGASNPASDTQPAISAYGAAAETGPSGLQLIPYSDSSAPLRLIGTRLSGHPAAR